VKTSELIEELAKEARQLKIGQKLPEHDPLPWEKIAAVRDDFSFLVEQKGVTIQRIGEALGPGFSRGPLSKFRNIEKREDFPGDVDKMARALNQFMETLVRRKQSKRPAGFVETDVARRILTVVGKTIELNSIGLIYGDAGRGKSMTLEAAKEIHRGAVLIRVMQSTRRPRGLAMQLGEALNLRVKRSTTHDAEHKIIEALRGTGRALLIDEAHQLEPDSLELVRDIHDETGCPIVLAGTMKLNDRVNDQERYFGQLSSRVALKYDLTEELRGGGGGGEPKPLHTLDEIRRLYESDKVRFTDDGRLLLTKLANLPGLGGLRLCTKVVQVARSLSQGEPIDAELLLRVIRTLHGSQGASQVEHQVERSRLRVA
jgi:DNA transposition AAA+ family ATPase